MKKKKFNLLLNIATLCLCVAAIAFGVYSAKNASLNVTGTIGFNAHNVEYDVVGWIYGHAGSDGKPVAEPTSEDNKVLLTKTEGVLTLGAREFSDLGDSGNPETINVVLQITNNSAFNIIVKADLTNSKSTDNKVTISAPISTIILGNTNDDKTGTIQFALSISADTQKVELDNSVSLKVDLEKTEYKATSVEVKMFTTEETKAINTGLNVTESYATKFPYYVEMGERDNKGKLKWLIIGVSGADGTLTALTTEDTTAFSKGLMLNKTYVMLSEKVLYTESVSVPDFSIVFQNAISGDGSSSPAFKNKNSVYSAQDYATSNVRSYLNGNTVQKGSSSSADEVAFPSGASVNLLSAYNLTDDPMYAKIQGRTLISLYVGLDAEKNSKAIIWSDNTTLPGTTKDKLWLLSTSEVKTLLGTTSRKTSTYGDTASSGAAWWLRSPHSGSANWVNTINVDGSLRDRYVNFIPASVRPAFLF